MKVNQALNLNAKIQTRRRVLPFAVVGLGVLAGLGLCLGVAALPSGEPAGLNFFEGGGPEADCRSLLNSNFLFAGGYEETIHVSKLINQHLVRMKNVHLYVLRKVCWRRYCWMLIGLKKTVANCPHFHFS